MKFLILPFLFLAIISNAQNMMPDQTINKNMDFKLEKYLGTWYEIARFNHSFERNMQGVTATYSMRKNGKIKVVNQGFIGSLNGKPKKAVGKARLLATRTPRNLEVSFFLFFYGSYNILELDENYQYALIGSNSSKYLWILSRTPQMEESTYNMLVENAKKRGYDISQIIKVEQPN